MGFVVVRWTDETYARSMMVSSRCRPLNRRSLSRVVEFDRQAEHLSGWVVELGRMVMRDVACLHVNAGRCRIALLHHVIGDKCYGDQSIREAGRYGSLSSLHLHDH